MFRGILLFKKIILFVLFCSLGVGNVVGHNYVVSVQGQIKEKRKILAKSLIEVIKKNRILFPNSYKGNFVIDEKTLKYLANGGPSILDLLSHLQKFKTDPDARFLLKAANDLFLLEFMSFICGLEIARDKKQFLLNFFGTLKSVSLQTSQGINYPFQNTLSKLIIHYYMTCSVGEYSVKDYTTQLENLAYVLQKLNEEFIEINALLPQEKRLDEKDINEFISILQIRSINRPFVHSGNFKKIFLWSVAALAVGSGIYWAWNYKGWPQVKEKIKENLQFFGRATGKELAKGASEAFNEDYKDSVKPLIEETMQVVTNQTKKFTDETLAKVEEKIIGLMSDMKKHVDSTIKKAFEDAQGKAKDVAKDIFAEASETANDILEGARGRAQDVVRESMQEVNGLKKDLLDDVQEKIDKFREDTLKDANQFRESTFADLTSFREQTLQDVEQKAGNLINRADTLRKDAIKDTTDQVQELITSTLDQAEKLKESTFQDADNLVEKSLEQALKVKDDAFNDVQKLREESLDDVKELAKDLMKDAEKLKTEALRDLDDLSSKKIEEVSAQIEEQGDKLREKAQDFLDDPKIRESVKNLAHDARVGATDLGITSAPGRLWSYLRGSGDNQNTTT